MRLWGGTTSLMTGVWQTAVRSLEHDLSPHTFDAWIRPAELLREEGTRIVVRVPSRFHKDWLEDHFLSQLRDRMRAATNQDYDVVFEVDGTRHLPGETGAGELTAAVTIPSPSTSEELAPLGCVLNPRYVFDTFVPGPSNSLAFTAARRVAECPAERFNPVLIYGESGLGKTHLLHAICNELRQSRPGFRICFISCERFLNDYITSLRSRSEEAFRRRYREEPDILLVDDIQILAGKEGMQNEFFWTFNALFEGHKQIVLTSDRPPSEIPDIPERLRSRFSWGLQADVGLPDFETRVAILKRKAELENITLPDEVLQLLAATFRRSVREMESALIRLAMVSSVDDRPITRELAESRLREITVRQTERISIDAVLKHVAEYFGCKVPDLKSPRRHAQITKPRAVAMYLCCKLTGCSLPEIGRGFGGKHHTTVLASRDKIAAQVDSNRVLRHELEAIERRIQEV